MEKVKWIKEQDKGEAECQVARDRINSHPKLGNAQKLEESVTSGGMNEMGALLRELNMISITCGILKNWYKNILMIQNTSKTERLRYRKQTYSYQKGKWFGD